MQCFTCLLSMKWAYIFVFLITSTNLTVIRNTYILALKSEESANKLKTLVSKEKGALAVAYYGSALALQAKYAILPNTKWSKAKKAAEQLNLAVLTDFKDIEIRYLRYSFEVNVPSIVGLKKHLKEDKAYILANQNITHPMWVTIQSFLKQCSDLSVAEKATIK